MKFTTFSLTELLSQIGEDKVRNKLKGFRSKDKDIENFLINKAIFFEKISISSTYLIFNSEKELDYISEVYTDIESFIEYFKQNKIERVEYGLIYKIVLSAKNQGHRRSRSYKDNRRS